MIGVHSWKSSTTIQFSNSIAKRKVVILMLTTEEIRGLSAANREKRWSAIPPTCPEKFLVRICEFRKGVLNGTIRQTKITKGLHNAALGAISDREKMRLQMIAAGIE